MKKAGLVARLIALIIDSIVIGLVAGLVIGVLGEQILGMGAGFLTGLVYNVYFWSGKKGQTPGKSLLGIRVVSTSKGGINMLQASIRYVGYYINTIVLLLGWLWAIVDDKHQGLHDKLAGTRVVKA
ncbi:MAG: RDD family protein [Anaerolineae bacterium]|nr:RDD family protein [Anaerolineae bacterium]